MSYEKLYHKELLDHYKHPKYRGVLQNPDISSGVFNPSCGDQVALQAYIKDGVITHCMFEGKGCVISLASASLLTEWASQKTVQEVEVFTPEDMLKMVKVTLGPNRVRCALLALEALHSGIKKYKSE